MTDPTTWSAMHDGRCAAMIEIAMAAGAHTRTYFRHPDLEFDAKKDDSPVTIADREAEQLVRKLIEQQFANDTVQGEEFAESSGTSDYRWVVDPIDGTKSFICGVPLYSTLLALEFQGEPLGGVIYIPALDEMIVAVVGQGSWLREGDSPWQPAKVSDRSSMQDAVFVTSQVDSFDERGAGDGYKQLQAAARITRSWGDGYGYLMVASGRADIMVDPICNAWDVAAIAPIVTEAGGTFTDWKGVPTTRGGDGVGTNGLLHQDVLRLLKA